MPDTKGRSGLDQAGRDLTCNPDVVVRDVELLAAGWHVLRRTTFDYRHADGRWTTEQRETYDRGNGATILLYDSSRRTVLLTRQFRFPVYCCVGRPNPPRVCNMFSASSVNSLPSASPRTRPIERIAPLVERPAPPVDSHTKRSKPPMSSKARLPSERSRRTPG